MKLTIVLLSLLITACGPKCLRGHNEVRHYPASSHIEVMIIGDMYIPYSVYDPPYNAIVFVCDQYELEKQPTTER